MIEKVHRDLNEKGHHQEDPRLDRTTRELTGYVMERFYPEPFSKTPEIKDKYLEDWKRMYPSYRSACECLEKDPYSRRAVIFNTTHYLETYPCFLMFHIVRNGTESYDLIVYQRSSDLRKMEDDIRFFEYVIHKIRNRAEIKITKLIIFYGSCHYETKE